MTTTERYGFPQWEKEDLIKMEDFNAAMLAIENAMPRIATGQYAGDGAATQMISLGFTPRAVLVMNNKGATFYANDYNNYYGGLATTEMNCTAVSITEGGFTVKYDKTNRIHTNNSGSGYNYIAIG